jgi:hypothetical protein
MLKQKSTLININSSLNKPSYFYQPMNQLNYHKEELPDSSNNINA